MRKPNTREVLEVMVAEAERQGWSASLPVMREARRVLEETKPTLPPCAYCGDVMCSGIPTLCPGF